MNFARLFFTALILTSVLLTSHGQDEREVEIQWKKKRAKKAVKLIENAIAIYFTEYRKYPKLQDEKADTLSSTSGKLAAILTVEEEETNAEKLEKPLRIDFLPLPEAQADGKGGWIAGRVKDGEKSAIYDPWGNPYAISFDTDYNSKIENPSGEGQLLEKVIIWSGGPDGEMDTWEDNIASWKTK